MDILNHGTQSFLITALPVTLATNSTAGIIAGAAFAIVGMLPDIIGEYYAHFKEKAGYKYSVYSKLHSLYEMKMIARVLLFTWYFHILQDSFLHTVGKRWWILKEWAWYEILTWVININYLIIFIKIL